MVGFEAASRIASVVSLRIGFNKFLVFLFLDTKTS